MAKHSHRFVEEYEGLVGFGFNREIDEYTLTYYLQKFSDDQLMGLIRGRMSPSDMEELFDFLNRLMRKYLTDEEYHLYFLKDEKESGSISEG
jgi:hypothetical protein